MGYDLDTTEYCNTAIVAGAGEGSERKIQYVNPENSGLNRRELYVDARDLQDFVTWNAVITTTEVSLSEETTEDGETIYNIKRTIKKVLTHPDTGEKEQHILMNMKQGIPAQKKIRRKRLRKIYRYQTNNTITCLQKEVKRN